MMPQVTQRTRIRSMPSISGLLIVYKMLPGSRPHLLFPHHPHRSLAPVSLVSPSPFRLGLVTTSLHDSSGSFVLFNSTGSCSSSLQAHAKALCSRLFPPAILQWSATTSSMSWPASRPSSLLPLPRPLGGMAARWQRSICKAGIRVPAVNSTQTANTWWHCTPPCTPEEAIVARASQWRGMAKESMVSSQTSALPARVLATSTSLKVSSTP